MRRVSIILLSQHFWPEENATSDLLSGIAFKLSESSYQIKAICGQPAYRVNGGKLPPLLVESGVVVKRIWSSGLDKNRKIGRIVNTMTFTISSLIYLLFSRKPDVLMYVTNPPTLSWVARLLKTGRGFPYIQITHDIYPEIAAAIHKIRKGGIIEKNWQFLNKSAYREAEKIIVLGDDMKKIIQEHVSDKEKKKVVVIPNWSDGDKILPRSRKNHPLLIKWGLSDKFIVQYSGNIGLFHEIETIIAAAEILKHNHDIHFLFIGDGGQLPLLKKMISDHDLKNVSIKPFQQKNKLPLSLTACNIGLVTLKAEATGLCVPSKLYGILAAGKPVITVAKRESEPGQTVIKFNCGVVVEPGDSEALAKEIELMSSDPESCLKLGKASRKAFEENFSLEIIANKYIEQLNNLHR